MPKCLRSVTAPIQTMPPPSLEYSRIGAMCVLCTPSCGEHVSWARAPGTLLSVPCYRISTRLADHPSGQPRRRSRSSALKQRPAYIYPHLHALRPRRRHQGTRGMTGQAYSFLSIVQRVVFAAVTTLSATPQAPRTAQPSLSLMKQTIFRQPASQQRTPPMSGVRIIQSRLRRLPRLSIDALISGGKPQRCSDADPLLLFLYACAFGAENSPSHGRFPRPAMISPRFACFINARASFYALPPSPSAPHPVQQLPLASLPSHPGVLRPSAVHIAIARRAKCARMALPFLRRKAVGPRACGGALAWPLRGARSRTPDARDPAAAAGSIPGLARRHSVSAGD